MSERYVGYRYPKSVIGYAVSLYHRFRLSLRTCLGKGKSDKSTHCCLEPVW